MFRVFFFLILFLWFCKFLGVMLKDLMCFIGYFVKLELKVEFGILFFCLVLMGICKMFGFFILNDDVCLILFFFIVRKCVFIMIKVFVIFFF